MDWWYKCETQEVNPEVIFMLQDAIKSVLRDGKSLASVCLYDDGSSFYIKVNNKFALNHFLRQNGFEELDDELPETGMTQHFGAA